MGNNAHLLFDILFIILIDNDDDDYVEQKINNKYGATPFLNENYFHHQMWAGMADV